MKTYKQFKKFLRDKCWNERDYGEWIYDKLIYDFLVEEVKEKPLSQKRAEAIERGKQHSTEYYSALSILEKLREWVDKELKLQGYEHQQILDKIDLLTSLETKEIENPTEESAELQIIKWFDSLKTPQPQFTPWQMIEVSNDGEKWEKREFAHTGRGIALADKTIYFYTTWLDPEYNDGRKLWEWWKFARPIKIEPELPEFNYEKLEENIRDVEFEKLDELRHMIGHIGKQTEALTKAYQALSRQKTTK